MWAITQYNCWKQWRQYFSIQQIKRSVLKRFKRFHHQLWKFDNCFNGSENLIISWHNHDREHGLVVSRFEQANVACGSCGDNGGMF